MLRTTLILVFICAALPCAAQTLAEELHAASVPTNSFSAADLAQTINAAHATDAGFTYVASVRVGKNNTLEGSPQIIRYDEATGTIMRRDLKTDDEMCCGSPDGIDFTRNYILFSFHNTPSANTVLAADHNLNLVEVLYGFDFHEIAPDQVIFIENMIHFASTHPERIMLADVRIGAAQELYPPKGDRLRAAFSREHKASMPHPDVCAALNDPCDPDNYDEDIQFLGADSPGRFAIRVTRNAVHAMAKDSEPESVVSESALYVYAERNGSWFYCEAPATGRPLERPACQPNLPVAVRAAKMRRGLL